MAAHIGHPPRSRRFIKVYLSAWALLAVGALGYLALLTFPPQAGAPPLQANLSPVDSGRTDSKALAEVRSMRGSLTEVRKDVTQLQEAVGAHVANEKVVETRLTALEERVSTIDGPQGLAGAAPEPSAPDKPGAPDKTAYNAGDPRHVTDIPVRQPVEPASPSAASPPFVPIETGSIASTGSAVPKAEIVFGEPVVTPASQTLFAVQLGAGTSAQVLRQSWGQLAERHAGALGTLQPRIVSPRAEGGFYRLLAGPVPTKADAERICARLGVGPKDCFPTAYGGSPL